MQILQKFNDNDNTFQIMVFCVVILCLIDEF